uniref:Si:dkey-10o6.2 n=1 Tax=Cyclopterus lumpus TaxID=8103 RepID=A0A8C3ANE2_CYCLU
MSIPVVDFCACSLSEEEVAGEQIMRELGKELESAFTEVGFVFLENTGITQEEVDRVMAISKTFFLQPEEEKRPFGRKSFAVNPNHGWVQMESERLNPDRPADLKESFNITSIRPDIKWPSGAAEGFQEIQTSFFRRCNELSLRVLRVMALSLGLDPQVFLSAHRFIGTEGNNTTLRPLYYPPVNHEKVKEEQLRCGEHSDYGSITLLFSCSGGLQVNTMNYTLKSRINQNGTFAYVFSDVQERQSHLTVSLTFRVLLPPAGDSSTRQSLAFFVHPDDEALITCCDGSDRYPPVTGRDYLLERYMHFVYKTHKKK